MIPALCRLFRPRLVAMNGVASLGGYLLFPGRPEMSATLALFSGVCLLAAAGSALNQVLERDLDALMLRTEKRPLPTGLLSPTAATLIGVGCAVAGLPLLAAFGGPVPALLGLATLLCYLAVYTPLKRRTPFALAFGALCGATPPVIGWTLAGGSPTDFRVVLLAGVFYLWQVPHFWLLQRRHADDYRRAGFPLFLPAVNRRGALPLCRLWVVAMIAGATLLPVFGMIGPRTALGCLALGLPLLFTAYGRYERLGFASLNLFPVVITLALCAGK